MSVRKREWVTREGESKEAWIVDYIDQRGKRHIETFQRKKEADARHAHVRVDIGKGIHVAPSESITVAAAAKNWLDDVKARDAERSTLMQYRQHVNLHIVPRIGRVKLAKLTKAQVEQFRKSLLDEMSLALARKVFTSFRSILKQAGYSHVAVGVRIKPRKRDHRLEGGSDFPEPGEIKRLIAATKTPRQRALVLTAALTGLRASELRGLRWKDVDLKANELHVRKRADRFNAIGEPKTKSSIRAVPLSPELVAAFREWKVGCPNGSLDLVFPARSGAVQTHGNMLDALDAVMRAAHVVDRNGRPKYGLHALRHFFASWCINPKDRGGRELPPKQVQRLLGHSSIVMTLDVYGHLFRDSGDRSELAEASRLLLA